MTVPIYTVRKKGAVRNRHWVQNKTEAPILVSGCRDVVSTIGLARRLLRIFPISPARGRRTRTIIDLTSRANVGLGGEFSASCQRCGLPTQRFSSNRYVRFSRIRISDWFSRQSFRASRPHQVA